MTEADLQQLEERLTANMKSRVTTLALSVLGTGIIGAFTMGMGFSNMTAKIETQGDRIKMLEAKQDKTDGAIQLLSENNKVLTVLVEQFDKRISRVER